MATTTKPMAKTTKATDKKRAPRSTSRKSAENGDQKKHYRPAPSLPMQNEGMLNMAIKAARDAGKIQVIAFRDRSNLQISNKSLGDYVTEVDKECERVIVETLKTAYPDHAFLGEETGESGKKDAEYTWVIDPLDGTTNFIHGIPQFAVSIALLKNGQPLHAVVYHAMVNELFTATKGKGAYLDSRRIRVSGCNSMQDALLATGFPFREGDNYDAYIKSMKVMMEKTCGLRRIGSAALDLCWTACGRFDGYWEKGIKIWDIAAGALIAREAGAFVTDFSGEGDYLQKGEIIAAAPKIFPEMVNVIQGRQA